MMSKLPEFTTQGEKTHVEETKGGIRAPED